ncbi:hypothetical protein SISNIDRAFT_486026 [Sistotremastrum niveocremeum HHB9708]|uniref:Tudor domain-containing protein n=1 Tax=Sistotremastrum niveocremeum HHB9708 TaxID=1314777 RepID=A0A164UBZ7_9AGAM|nr:hypothetical protein SISNIDRAFT_486026 [Sistotremastrum niveocremeum HHB9708]
MDPQELETYQAQLSQVELALAADPGNEELSSLRAELAELIELTEASLAQSESSKAAEAQRKSATTTTTNTTSASFGAGDEVLAKYSGDGTFYPARVTSVGGSADHRVYSIVFKGYNTTEVVTGSSLKPIPPGYVHNATTASTSKRKMTQEEEDERERKKKKNEKKLETRAAKAKEQNEKQATWQKFTKKAEKKGVQIAGVAGTSIFKTPENPLGRGKSLRFGVTGSGKGMTDYAQRNKHIFKPDGTGDSK